MYMGPLPLLLMVIVSACPCAWCLECAFFGRHSEVILAYYRTPVPYMGSQLNKNDV